MFLPRHMPTRVTSMCIHFPYMPFVHILPFFLPPIGSLSPALSLAHSPHPRPGSVAVGVSDFSPVWLQAVPPDALVDTIPFLDAFS